MSKAENAMSNNVDGSEEMRKESLPKESGAGGVMQIPLSELHDFKVHTDIDSEDQTISFESKPDVPKTGDHAKPALVITFMVCALGLGIGMYIASRIYRRREDHSLCE